jgi:hypothetical protein
MDHEHADSIEVGNSNWPAATLQLQTSIPLFIFIQQVEAVPPANPQPCGKGATPMPTCTADTCSGRQQHAIDFSLCSQSIYESMNRSSGRPYTGKGCSHLPSPNLAPLLPQHPQPPQPCVFADPLPSTIVASHTSRHRTRPCTCAQGLQSVPCAPPPPLPPAPLARFPLPSHLA